MTTKPKSRVTKSTKAATAAAADPQAEPKKVARLLREYLSMTTGGRHQFLMAILSDANHARRTDFIMIGPMGEGVKYVRNEVEPTPADDLEKSYEISSRLGTVRDLAFTVARSLDNYAGTDKDRPMVGSWYAIGYAVEREKAALDAVISGGAP